MKTTAKDIQDFALASINAICQFPGRSKTSIYNELAEYSGLSASIIRRFHLGERPNLSISSLDKLVAAVKKLMRKAAA